MRDVLVSFANELLECGAIDERERFIDANFAMAKGGREEIEPIIAEKGVKSMAIVDRHGLPVLVR